MLYRARYSTSSFALFLFLLGVISLALAAPDVTSIHPQTSYSSTTVATRSDTPSTRHTTVASSKSGHKSTSTSTIRTSTFSSKPTETHISETCRSASINYVTNRLPQQCWTGSASPTTSLSGENEAPGTASSATAPAETNVPKQSQNIESLVKSPDDAAGSADATKDSAAGQPSPVPDSTTADRESVSATSAAASPSASQADTEADSLLDQAEFLSFEEWKKKKLNHEKSEQDSGKFRDEDRRANRHEQHPGINHALDSLGDEGEIYLDLSSFGGANRPEDIKQASASGSVQNIPEQTGETLVDSPPKLSKDAGKTCKERSNYASFDCAANVLKTNPKCKSPSSILVENKDSYMLNKCSEENKFLIVELCENIIIDTVVLANFEFFSSMFRQFRISVSDRYPVKPDKWVDLGTFEARNSRDIQPFLIKSCPIFARYLRVELLTHYGNEYYCPLSLLRVHGTTMYEDWRRHNQGRDADEEEELVPAEAKQEAQQVAPAQGALENVASVASVVEDSEAQKASSTSTDISATQPPSARQPVPEDPSSTPTPPPDLCNDIPEPVDGPMVTSQEECPLDASPTSPSAQADSSSTSQNSPSKSPASANLTNAVSTISTKTSSTTLTSTINNNSTIIQSESPASTNATVAASTAASQDSSKSSKTASTTTLSATLKPAQASYAPTPYQPPTQESFFKSIHKRLSFLEANSTLSLQYIESQSALLRDAFAKVEKRQINKTSSFLETLNATITAELAHFKSEYDRLWQSAVMELASQREESKKERELLGERVRMLAEEMGNQKRLMAAQATLMLLCLGLVVFGKMGGSGPTLDTGLLHGMQEIVAKAKEARMSESEKMKSGWRWESPWSSPSRRSKSSPEAERTLNHHEKSEYDEDGNSLGIVVSKTSLSSYEEDDADHTAIASSQQGQSLKPPHLVKHLSAPTTPNGKG